MVKRVKDFRLPRAGMRTLGSALGFAGLGIAFLTAPGCSKKEDEPVSPSEWKTPGKTFSNYDQRKWLSADNTYIAAEEINGTGIDLLYSDTATGTPVTVADDGNINQFVAFTGDEKYIVFEKKDTGDTYRTLYAWDIATSQLFQATPSSGRFQFKDFDDQATEFCYVDIDTGQKFVHKLGTTFTQNTEFTGSEIQEYAYDKNSDGEFLIILSRDMGGGKHDLLLKDPKDDSETNVTNTPSLDEIFIFEFRKLTGNGQPLDQGTWLILQETSGGNYRVLEWNPRDKQLIREYADSTHDSSIPNDPEGVPLVSDNERYVVIHRDFGGGEQHVFLYDRHENGLKRITPDPGFFHEANLIADNGNIVLRRLEFGNVYNVLWYWNFDSHLTMVTNDGDKNNYAVAISMDGEFFAYVNEDEMGGGNKKLIATRNRHIHDKKTVSTSCPAGPTGGVPFGARFVDLNDKQMLLFSEEMAPGGDVEVKEYDHSTKATPANVTNDSLLKDYMFQRSGDKTKGIIKSQNASTEKMKVYDGTSVEEYN